MKSIQINKIIILASILVLSACDSSKTSSPGPKIPSPKDNGDPLVSMGRDLFFKETFNGNGRTCGTCHRAENNLTIDKAFIATLPKKDPLFVAEFVPALKENFENPKLMREFGLILENQDGFDDLANNFNMRGVPHVFAQGISIDSPDGPHTGWSGDGAPGDGSLRSFSTGAVIQHFTKTTQRRSGIDFRLPTEKELDALEAFQLTLGRQKELQLPLPLKNAFALRGQELFQNEGRCAGCHANAGANTGFGVVGNLNFNTGVENLPDQPADLSGELNPEDDGAGNPGNGAFNTPSLVEAADTPPFFHNNAVESLEAAVAFYNNDAFANSPAGQRLANTPGGRINLDATQIDAIAAFLRVINTLDNIREVNTMLTAVARNEYLSGEHPRDLVGRVGFDIDDAIMVLSSVGLHPKSVENLQDAKLLVSKAVDTPSSRIKLAKRAIKKWIKPRLILSSDSNAIRKRNY